MPTYAYACKNCGHRFDAVQSFSEPSLTECPECGGPLRKEYGSVGVTFNGSGFYRTDSRTTSGASETSSTESKSEAKASEGVS
ncbi:MAG: FmdB family zinc ribbon protein [Microbacterium sp.]|uniref:FmdB family zinc ribbon protein n=1 Tax=Microbacterium sp. TaxID=51671 RepID=UPI003A89E9A6